MEREFDVRPLIVGNLKNNNIHNIRIKDIVESDKFLLREFNEGYTWNTKKATYFIESLILGCEVHPFITFNFNNKLYICDGINRYLTIKKFINDEFKLNPKGLTKLKWLGGKRFRNLKDTEKNFFKHNIFLSYIDYSYENKSEPYRVLTKQEAIAIQKQLYVRYNAGIRLAIEELQKAQFEGEYLTEKFRKLLEEKEEYKDLLKSLYIGKRSKKKNEIDCILVEIRYLIASTYSNIREYCYCTDKSQRINYFYEDKLCPKSDKEKEAMFEDFNICIEFLKKIFDLKEWDDYPDLHNKYFIQVLYWAISVIRREKSYPLSKIDLRTLISYFGKTEDEYNRFVTKGAHRIKPMADRYLDIAKYFKKYYSQDLLKEFKTPEPALNNPIEKEINVQQIYMRRTPYEVKVSTLLEQIKNFRYNIRPTYQRQESMNIEASSRVIESILTNIQIPPILVFEKVVDGETVYEVIDGQQRLLSLIGYTESFYKNEHGEECHSEKEGYALTGLDIYYELNESKYKSHKSKKLLNDENKRKIMDSTVYYAVMEKHDPKEARDHFVRLNSNITPLTHGFSYWNAMADQILLDKVEEICSRDYQKILGKNNVIKINQKYILSLSYIMYQMKNNKNYTHYTNIQLFKVTNWLKEFNKFKYERLLKNNDQEISLVRNKYMDALIETEQFLIKINMWLEHTNKNIREMFNISTSSAIALKSLSCLLYFLNDISLDDMNEHSKDIERLLRDFYTTIHKREVDIKKEQDYLMITKEKIDMLDSNIEKKVHEKMLKTVF